MVPRRLAGPGDPAAVWSALTRRGWQPADWHPEGAGLLSPGYDLVLVAAEREDQAVWKITAHPGTPLSPARWSAELTRNTPAEIVVDTLTHLDGLRARDPHAALGGPHDVRDLFTAAERAGWELDIVNGQTAYLGSPDFGPERIEVWHNIDGDWYPSNVPGTPATGITSGGHLHENDEADIWRATFSRLAPAHLVTAVLQAALSPKPVSRRESEIPALYRAAVTTATTSAPPDNPTPSDSPAPDPSATRAPIDWDFTNDDLGNRSYRSLCRRVTIQETPEDHNDVERTSRWIISAKGDERTSWAGNLPDVSWTAALTAHTPPTVVAAVADAIKETTDELDTLEVRDDFENSPEPSFVAYRTYGPDPVPGSRDPDLAHARLRLHGWEKTDRPRAAASRSPDGEVELWSVSATEPSTLDVVPAPASWTLDGGTPPNLWTATFSPATPTTLVLAAAREAARLAEPGPAPPGSAPRLGLSAGRVQAARTRTTTPAPAAAPTEAAKSAAPTGRRRAC
ncbi:DUF317 domain-containing protein [Kitasatospora sp. NPDC059327]|uniref:DUF317 domain-containing protein n=1 Tax=Kitasatospora sp. NPDC059327 TaxID=3346803 RepID=UPI0036BC1047